MNQSTNTVIRAANGTSNSQDFWQNYLGRGEKLLWHGQPEKWISFQNISYKKLLPEFAIIGFMIFWMSSAARAHQYFSLFGLIALIPAIWRAYKLIFQPMIRLRNTRYALSNQSALIYTPNHLRTIPLRSNLRLSVEHHHNLDSIYFDESAPLSNEDDFDMEIDYEKARKLPRPGFEMISKGRQIYQLILNAQRSSA